MAADSASNETEAVLTRALHCLTSGSPNPITGPQTSSWSERCVEVPWIAGHLKNRARVLDLGFAMSPPEWLGVLLACQAQGSFLAGLDIVDPQRVSSRYPEAMRNEVLDVPVHIEDFLVAEPRADHFDTIVCLSTLEHIGFDRASPLDQSNSVFLRASTPDQADAHRDSNTDRRFLDAVCRFISDQGSLLISVPVGADRPILHEDSLGLFTYQFEYGEESWSQIIEDPRFEVVSQGFFRHDPVLGWHQVEHFADLTDQTSELKPFATGCATAHLRRRIA